jgi:hypothetical protein
MSNDNVTDDGLDTEVNHSTPDDTPVINPANMMDPPPPPPSSVHGEVDEDDRPLEDSFHENEEREDPDMLADSNNLRSDSMNAVLDDMETAAPLQHPSAVPTPQQPELTMKEKLVLRERQRRIETERARLKRQFALSAASNEEGVDARVDGTPYVGHNFDLDVTAEDALGSMNDQEFEEESTRAHPDEEEAAADEANRRLGFNMERFLRNSDSFHPGPSETDSNRIFDTGATPDTTKGVVMERFLNELVENASLPPDSASSAFGVAASTLDEAKGEPSSEPHRSVSFDVDAVPAESNSQLRNLDFSQDAALTISQPSFGEESGAGISLASNASLLTEVNTARDDVFSLGDPPQYTATSLDVMHETDDVSQGQISSHVSDDEPRVLRLTEADMLEMAAIEEASIGNAPPSDRDEVESYSEIGEMTDFGGSGAAMHRFLGENPFTSPDTPTTAVDSASQLSHRSAQRGGTSAVSSSSATNDHVEGDHVLDPLGSIDGILPLLTSDSTDYFVAPTSASVAANPPSDRGHDDDVDVESQLMDVDRASLNDLVDGEEPMDLFPFDNTVLSGGLLPNVHHDLRQNLNDTDVANTTNRQRRYNHIDHNSLTESVDDPVQGDNVVDGFNFDKDAPRSPFLERPLREHLSAEDSFRNLPTDSWSPQGQMSVSPLPDGTAGGRRLAVAGIGNGTAAPSMPLPTQHSNYGTSPNIGYSPTTLNHLTLDGEKVPLLHSSSIPPEIITRRDVSIQEDSNDPDRLSFPDRRGLFENERFSWFRGSDRNSIRSAVESVFSDVRSEEEEEKVLLQNESEVYLTSNILARGMLFLSLQHDKLPLIFLTKFFSMLHCSFP